MTAEVRLDSCSYTLHGFFQHTALTGRSHSVIFLVFSLLRSFTLTCMRFYLAGRSSCAEKWGASVNLKCVHSVADGVV